MNDLCADIGSQSLNKYGEQLCGDHVDVIDKTIDDSILIVLADGLGSGVKACILSTLTAKILSTMMADGLNIYDCVQTIADTLPVCAERRVAYSTFTIIKIRSNREAEIFEYDNPALIFLRDGRSVELPKTIYDISGKQVYHSKVDLKENDLFVAVSDGAVHAGVGQSLNFGWERKDIISFMETFYEVGFTAKTLSTILLDECFRLYGGQPGDDTTVCTVRIRRREQVNLMFGPSSNRDDTDKMMSLFFAKEGKHIISGGTTSSLAAKYLGRPLVPSLDFVDDEIPPTASIEGVDLVTEGVITINRVLSYAEDYLKDNEGYEKWSSRRDGASLIARMLFEDATDINFFVGRAMNPAHQNPDLPINFNIKMNLVAKLSDCLEKMGKRIKVSYF